MNPPALTDIRIGVIDLGHVGLPLAAHLARQFPVLGSYISEEPRR